MVWIVIYLLIGMVTMAFIFNELDEETQNNIGPKHITVATLLWPVLMFGAVSGYTFTYTNQDIEDDEDMACNCEFTAVKIKKLREDAIFPEYQTEGAAGFDFAIPENILLYPFEKKLIKLGWAVAIPEGLEMQVRPRSGLSLNTGLHLSNSPGTIDSDYRGEVGLIVENRGDDPLQFKRGDRLAQGILSSVYRMPFQQVDDLPVTDRNEGGYGSTGVS